MPDQKEKHDADWASKDGTTGLFEPYRYRMELCAGLVASLKPALLLDLGCGTGFMAGLVKARLPRVRIDGVDFSPYALSMASSLDGKIEADIDSGDLPLSAGTYDCVLCTEFLEHLYEPAHALKEMARVLKPGGRAVITTPNYALLHNRAASLAGRLPQTMLNEQHIRFYTYSSLSALAESAGFRVEARYGARRRFSSVAALWPALLSEWVILLLEKGK
ncbi:MAG: class I SAM-dependent methyltransferase [Elusimicrobia bacterium]|nr:class I SAM-dependent methyltransferase [Elusimicrobiota bacterium]